jgi:hypothetical protein
MKKIIIISIGVILIVGGYFVYKSFYKQQTIPTNCAKEGEIIGIMPLPDGEVNIGCCNGLTGRGVYSDENEVSVLMDIKVCVNCSNGECGVGENNLNCPEDCGDGDNIVCGDLNLDECKNNNQCIQLGGEIEMWGAENGEPFNEWKFLPEKCVMKKLEFSSCEYLVVAGNTSSPSIPNECRCIVKEIKDGRRNHLQLCPKD